MHKCSVRNPHSASDYSAKGSRDSLLVERRTRDRKVANSNPDRSGGRMFFSKVNFVCYYSVLINEHAVAAWPYPRSTSLHRHHHRAFQTPMSPQWHVNKPSRFAKIAGGMLHLNTHTPLTQRSRSGLTVPLSRHSVGTYPETSSHATCQGTFGHGRLSSLSHCDLILA